MTGEAPRFVIGARRRPPVVTWSSTRGCAVVTLSLSAAVVSLLGTAGTLAQQPTLPEGPGKAEFQRVCAGCHPAEDAIKGARRSRDGWQQVVDDMVVRGAEGNDRELKLVVDYLVAHFGPSSGPR